MPHPSCRGTDLAVDVGVGVGEGSRCRRPRDVNRHIVISIIDQMLISAMMFAINLLLIGLAGAENFGRFIVVLSAYFLTYGAQNALILLPVNVLIPGAGKGARRRKMRMLATVDIASSASRPPRSRPSSGPSATVSSWSSSRSVW